MAASDITVSGLNKVGAEDAAYLVSKIRTIPGFPKEGILFRDFMPVLADARAFGILMGALEAALPVDVDDFDMVALETVTNQYLGGDASLACSAETQTKIDALVVALVKREHEKAVKLLNDHRSKLDELSQYLYEKETITGEEFMKILNLEKAQDKTQD